MGAVFAERLNRSIRDLLKRPVFETSNGIWIDVLRTLTKQYSTRAHTSTKLSPKDASLKKNERFVHQNLTDKRKKIKPKYETNNLIRTADLKKTFSKGGTTNWSYKLYEITEITNDTIPSYQLDKSSERCNETLLKKAELAMKEKDSVMKKIYIT